MSIYSKNTLIFLMLPYGHQQFSFKMHLYSADLLKHLVNLIFTKLFHLDKFVYFSTLKKLVNLLLLRFTILLVFLLFIIVNVGLMF